MRCVKNHLLGLSSEKYCDILYVTTEVNNNYIERCYGLTNKRTNVKTRNCHVGFEILTPSTKKISDLGNVTLCSRRPTFRRNGKQSDACRLLLAGFVVRLFFDADDVCIVILRNVSGLVPDYTAVQPRR
jgi:hypothetical protein